MSQAGVLKAPSPWVLIHLPATRKGPRILCQRTTVFCCLRMSFRAAANSKMSGLSKVSGSKVCGNTRRLNSPGQTVVAGLRRATSTRIRALSATASAATWALSTFLPLQRREQIPPPSSLEGRGKEQIRQRSGCSRAMASPAKTQLGFCSRATTLFRPADEIRKDSVTLLFPSSSRRLSC